MVRCKASATMFRGLVLGRIEANVQNNTAHFATCFKIYQMYAVLHCSKFDFSQNVKILRQNFDQDLSKVPK